MASFVNETRTVMTDEPPTNGEARREPPSGRTRVRRLAERGNYESATIRSILDQGLVCHVGFTGPDGPVVIPTAYARIADELYLHGAVGNAALRALSAGAPACVTVTIIDGLVLARSAFNHSINYRSVVIFGHADEVRETEAKRAALTAIVEHLVPGRGADARPPNDDELRATKIIRLPIDEASAKIRVGGPHDDEADLELAIWSGVVPLRLVAEPPVADGAGVAINEPPPYATRYGERWATENERDEMVAPPKPTTPE
jgi:hypothetical protein